MALLFFGIGMKTDLHQVKMDWGNRDSWKAPKKSNAIECSDYHTIALISHAHKVMLKILQARLQYYLN